MIRSTMLTHFLLFNFIVLGSIVNLQSGEFDTSTENDLLVAAMKTRAPEILTRYFNRIANNRIEDYLHVFNQMLDGTESMLKHYSSSAQKCEEELNDAEEFPLRERFLTMNEFSKAIRYCRKKSNKPEACYENLVQQAESGALSCLPHEEVVIVFLLSLGHEGAKIYRDSYKKFVTERVAARQVVRKQARQQWIDTAKATIESKKTVMERS